MAAQSASIEAGADKIFRDRQAAGNPILRDEAFSIAQVGFSIGLSLEQLDACIASSTVPLPIKDFKSKMDCIHDIRKSTGMDFLAAKLLVERFET